MVCYQSGSDCSTKTCTIGLSFRCIAYLKIHSLFIDVSLVGRIYKFRNKGMEIGLCSPFILSPSELRGEAVFPVPGSLGSVCLDILIRSGSEVLPPRDKIKVGINSKSHLPSGHFVFLVPVKEQAQKGHKLAGEIDPYLHEVA